jgi:hypothetical protein
MDKTVEAFQVGGVDLLFVRIPPDVTRSGLGSDEARDLVAARDEVRNHGGADHAMGTSD